MSTHRFVLPRRDGSWLVEPALGRWIDLVAENHNAFSQSTFDCQGRPLDELRRATQQQVRRAAASYTSKLLGGDVAPPEGEQWIVTGHQPELFHLGVWAKNFAVAHLARTTQAVGLNLIVDNDAHGGTTIAVPTGSRAEPRTEHVEFDAPRPICPWEDLPLADLSRFAAFPSRLTRLLSPWGIRPIAPDVWPAAVEFARRSPQALLGDCLAAARIAAERRFGAANLEFPLSQLEVLPGFLWFAANILARLPEFVRLHNDSIRAYRRRNRLRSRTHPVPELAREGDWLEAPFWAWRAGETLRDRVFARQAGPEILLRDRKDVFLRLPLTPERSACCAVEQMATMPDRGIRLRSRALTTTLFARLFLADLFVHGIGGAKYDEMTDELIAGFYQLPVPRYATISATAHLPLGGLWDVIPPPGELAAALWDVTHNPERHAVRLSESEQRLVEEKRRLVAEQHAVEARPSHRRSIAERDRNHRRYQRLREINRLLQPAAAAVREALEARRAELAARQAANRILGNREYSWALFPEERLRAFATSVPLAGNQT